MIAFPYIFDYPRADLSTLRDQWQSFAADTWTNFPDADIPPIPAGCVDVSWRQDVCPSVHCAAADMRVFLDYADPDKREEPSAPRFSVYLEINDPEDGIVAQGETVYAGDDFSMVLAHLIAQAFGKQMREEFTPREIAEINRRNAEYAARGVTDCCASHEFCDANMVMLEAWEGVLGRSLTMSEETPEEASQQQADFNLWGTAWDLAKAAGFAQPKIQSDFR